MCCRHFSYLLNKKEPGSVVRWLVSCVMATLFLIFKTTNSRTNTQVRVGEPQTIKE